ncbi:MAG: class I SAM-dependent methyltransferase [Candidatus Hodarchaeota archaeon]
MKGTRFLQSALSRINRYTVERRVEVVLPWVKGDVLDIGCGLAYLAEFVGKEHLYVGIDINEERISLLRQENMNRPDRQFWYVDVDEDISADLPLLNSTFDTITLLAVIEHLWYPKNVLSFSYRLLRNQGLLLITTPTRLGDKISRLVTMTTLGTRELPYPHVRIYNRASLTNLVEEGGFRVNAYRKFELGMNQLFICSRKSG